MRRSKKFILMAALVAVVLIGSLAGIALAQTGNTDGTTSGKTLLSRVATILGIDQQKVEDAFKQAQSEMREEALDSHLKSLVEKGVITQEQADQYKAWWQARPDVTQFEQQLKGWQQARPEIPPELKNWQEARPNIPIPDGFGGRGFRAPRGLGGRGLPGTGGFGFPMPPPG